MSLPELAQWLRDLERQSQAPAGQPNLAAENFGEVAAFLEAYVDMDRGIVRKAKLQDAVKAHNGGLVDTCNERRAHPTTPCGGGTGIRCPDCPRTLGLTAGASVAVTVEDGRLVLAPVRPRYSLAELLAGMKPGDMPTAPGWADARPVGRETW